MTHFTSAALPPSPCPFCNQETFQEQIIYEFANGYWIAAQNQYYPGYSILISKPHVREWHEMPEDIALALHDNLRLIARTIQATLQPHKINLAAFGNVVEHLHWHIVPRYLSDPHHLQAPDLAMPASLTLTEFKKLKKIFFAFIVN